MAKARSSFSRPWARRALCFHGFRRTGHWCDGFRKAPIAFQLALELLYGGQICNVLRREKLLMFVQNGVPSDGFVLLSAEDKTIGRAVTIGTSLRVEHSDIAVHLADVLMRKLAEFEIDQHVALENDVIEDKVDVELLVLEGEALLPGNKREPLAEL